MERRGAVKFRPLHDNVLVKRLDAAEEKIGGIIIPDTAKEKPQEGNVLAVGPGKLQDDGTRRPVGVAVGNKILFGKYAGTEITVEGEELLVLRETDLLGVLE
jgi:chaperonin GroES